MSLVYTIGLALLDFNNRAKKLSYLALFKVHLFLTVFQRRLSADKSPQNPKGQAFRLYLFCRSDAMQLIGNRTLCHSIQSVNWYL